MYINESDVKKLKQGTGCGLVDCRRALTICNGNYIEAWRRLIYPQKYNFTITREDIMPEDKVPNANKLEGEVIRVVDTDTISISGLNRLNPRIQVIKISNLNSISNQYSLPSGIYPGDILFKHPFLPNTYINSSISEQEFFKQKIKCIASICQELGAKSITGKAEWIESKKMECSFGGNITTQTVSSNANYITSEKARIEKSYYISQHYAGSSPNIGKAENLTQIYGLSNDFDIKDLINSRSRNNSILSQDIRISLSEELNKSKEIAFSLNALSIFKLSGSIKDRLSILNSVNIALHIDF